MLGLPCHLRFLIATGATLLLWSAGFAADAPRSVPAASRPAGGTAAPAAIDLRPIFANWGLDIRRQGGRGTCSVFAVTGAIEYALAGRDRRATPLSVEFLNWAANEAIGQPDDGSFFSDLWRGFERYGICPEADLPYRPTFDSKLRPGESALRHARQVRGAGLRLHWIKPWDPNRGLNEEELAGVKAALARQWPVCGGFLWPKKEEWKDGVLNLPPRAEVHDGHSVLLVGYRDDPKQPGGGVFHVRNSGGGLPDGCMTYDYIRAYMNDAVYIDHEVAGTRTALDPLLSPVGPPPAGRNRRVSSNQQPAWHTENLDMNWLMPGDSVEMPLLEGPGLVTHMWFTSHAGWAGELNALRLRIYWDGREKPGVDVPLGDFFAVGQGRPAVVESIPVQVSPTGSLTCYWRMPFEKSARITVTNDNPDRSTGLYWQVDWTQIDALPAGLPYFHAGYWQAYPAAPGQDYLFAELEGSGFYVGTVMSVTLAQDGWFGEGDDFFNIDGEDVPSLQGTGSEDYFNDAWGFRTRTGLWFGQPRWQGDRAGDSGVCYRWHLPDPVQFTRSLKATIEHKGNRDESEDGFFLERPDFFSSVAFWYQTGEPKNHLPLPPWSARRPPWQHQHLVRAFQQAQATGETKPQVQTTGFFGARPVLAWPNKTPGAQLALPFRVDAAGRYAVRLTAGSGPECGTYELLIDGRPVLTHDFRAAEFTEADLLLGTYELAAGDHVLAFRAANTTERPGALIVEMLRLLPLPPEAKRTVRTHHEAHFIRLGIGRAVYAYRLAYGKLPESLQALVDCGIMPARYLTDENGRALQFRREGDAVVVESTGPEPWSHRWRGLDARR